MQRVVPIPKNLGAIVPPSPLDACHRPYTMLFLDILPCKFGRSRTNHAGISMGPKIGKRWWEQPHPLADPLHTCASPMCYQITKLGRSGSNSLGLSMDPKNLAALKMGRGRITKNMPFTTFLAAFGCTGINAKTCLFRR